MGDQGRSNANDLKRYRTIVADPPWRYSSARITTTGKQRRAEAMAHYGTMTLDDICALPVEGMAADDAHLYLWITCPLLPWAERVVNAWGFEYRTLLTWEKQGTLGMGFHFRVQTEHVVFATRGNLPIEPAKRIRNIFAAPKGRHSEKPDLFYDLVESVSPEPRVELFARRARLAGWDYWGDQSLGTAQMAPPINCETANFGETHLGIPDPEPTITGGGSMKERSDQWENAATDICEERDQLKARVLDLEKALAAADEMVREVGLCLDEPFTMTPSTSEQLRPLHDAYRSARSWIISNRASTRRSPNDPNGEDR